MTKIAPRQCYLDNTKPHFPGFIFFKSNGKKSLPFDLKI
jgi:hypothetical protein